MVEDTKALFAVGSGVWRSPQKAGVARGLRRRACATVSYKEGVVALLERRSLTFGFVVCRDHASMQSTGEGLQACDEVRAPIEPYGAVFVTGLNGYMLPKPNNVGCAKWSGE